MAGGRAAAAAGGGPPRSGGVSVVTRFAPSPTGDLHLGHAYAACYARDVAKRSGGRFLVRIEDIDTGRCRPEFIGRNIDDLRWLGIAGSGPVVRQSERIPLYRAALDRLQALGVTYPCFCTRAEIRAEVAAAAVAPHPTGPDGAPVYPGTCRALDPARRDDLQASGRSYAVRLNLARARHLTGDITWTDRLRGTVRAEPERLGDVVVARKDVATSYHLAVVVDDADQGVTEVTRGADLLDATHIHRLLYGLLDLPVPVWHHHALVRDTTGRRLAKRSGDEAIAALRDRGYTPEQVLAMAAKGAR